MLSLNNTSLEEGPHDDCMFMITHTREDTIMYHYSYCEIFIESIIKQMSKEKRLHTGLGCGKEILFGFRYEGM